MFPTRAKAKIAKSLSYPLKAKALSEALAEVPQADDFQIWFSNHHTPAQLRRLTKFRLVQVQYLDYTPSRFAPPLSEEAMSERLKWTIQVYAVPVEIRARVAELLQNEALPKICAWLLTKTDFSQSRSCRYEVFYHEPDDLLKYSKRET